MPVVRLILLIAPCAVAAQDRGTKPTDGNLLQITSPLNGTVINPGQTIQVTVTSPANVSFKAVAVVGEPIGISRIATSLPATFSFSLPTDISCRSYKLTALGMTPTGQEMDSPTVLIDVERPDLPISLSASIPIITLDHLGQTFPIGISATFSDGSVLDVTDSSNLLYSSSNSNVAEVDATGILTALAVGNATLTATYAGNLQINIPVTVPTQALDPSPNLLNFGNQPLGIGSTRQIVFTNKTAGPMQIRGITTTGDFTETDTCISSSPLASGSTCTINVTFTPTEVGPRQGSVSVSEDFSGGLTIRLSGTATTPLK